MGSEGTSGHYGSDYIESDITSGEGDFLVSVCHDYRVGGWGVTVSDKCSETFFKCHLVLKNFAIF